MDGGPLPYPRHGRFALRFASDALEQRYREFFLDQDKRQAIVAIALYTALKASFGLIDLMVQAGAQAEQVLFQRYAFVLISLLALGLMTRVGHRRHYDALVFAWALLAVASTFYTISHRPSNNFGFVSTSPMLIILFFAFFRNRFELQLIASLLLVVTDLFTVFLLRDPQPAAVRVQICATYATALLVGIVVSRQLKLSRRSHYAALQRERELADAMRELAYRDELTGVLNRRSFLLQAGASWRRPAHGDAGCVLILDLDHFKRLNDTHGHDAGDGALLAFAGLVQSLKDEHDVFGRVGGEEFALLLPGASRARAEALAESILVGCRALPVGARSGGLSVSIGIAPIEPGDHDLAATMRRADRALYAAKASGRGRWCTAGDVMVPV